SCFVTNCLLGSGCLGIFGKHLLDTHLPEAPFGILGPWSNNATDDSGLDWDCRDAPQRLALRPNRGTTLSRRCTAPSRGITVWCTDRWTSQSFASNLMLAGGQRVVAGVLSTFLVLPDNDSE